MSDTKALTVTREQGDGRAEIAQADRPALAPQASPRHNLNHALIPQSFEQLERFSKAVARSQMVPKPFQGRPDDVMVAVMHGLEIGLKPLQALQNIAVINGKPSIYGDAAIALVRQAPVCRYVREWIEGEGDARAAFCETHRRGEPEPQVRSFSVADAKRANLWGKRGPWQDYPQRMLQMRARSWLLRDVYADVLAGLYIAEEAMDIPSEGNPSHEEPAGTDYAAAVRQARAWLESRRDEDLTEAIAQLRAKVEGWPETYRDEVEAAIEAEKERRRGARLEEAEGEDAAEAPEPDYNAEIDRLRAELGAAYGDEAKWNAAVDRWRKRLADWPERQTQRANRAVQETLRACREKERAEQEAKDESVRKAAEAIQRGETAIKKPKPLPDSVPYRDMLLDAGIKTKAQAIEAYRSGELTEIKGIGKARAVEIASALGIDAVQSETGVSVETDDGSDLFG